MINRIYRYKPGSIGEYWIVFGMIFYQVCLNSSKEFTLNNVYLRYLKLII